MPVVDPCLGLVAVAAAAPAQDLPGAPAQRAAAPEIVALQRVDTLPVEQPAGPADADDSRLGAGDEWMQTRDPALVSGLSALYTAVPMVHAGVGKHLLSWRP